MDFLRSPSGEFRGRARRSRGGAGSDGPSPKVSNGFHKESNGFPKSFLRVPIDSLKIYMDFIRIPMDFLRVP
jgi:hypothetical protein